MAEPIWGNLAKSQIDPEKIEEAIARLIQTHEDDPDAHLEVGESLQSHKASEIIDHLARSIVFDKTAASQMIFYTAFENSGVFDLVGAPIFKFPGFLAAGSAVGFANREEVIIKAEDAGLGYDFGKDFILQFTFSAEIIANGIFRFVMNSGQTSEVERVLGLTIDAGTAKFFIASGTGANKTYLDWPGYSNTTLYVIRIEYVATDEKAYFYINNVLLGSLTTPTPTANDPLYIHFACWHTAVPGSGVSILNFDFQLTP